MIEIKNLKKYYKDRLILEITNLNFSKGKIYSILGRNGAGKSTLLKILGGILSYDEGNLRYDRDNVILSTQEPLFFKGNVIYNITEPFKLRNLKIELDKVTIFLKEFQIEKLKESSVDNLSGGEKAKIQFIRTILYNKKILLLDEPTASMDKKSTYVVERILSELRDMGCLIIIVTHDYEQAVRISNYIYEVDEGKIIQRGT
ncbi:ATP-binding cassette domain-containing protein (plasmid) [Cetobacterium somerae]|uniref:ABC transporter ATP-binding protein n=1 Tax=Cetobacterium somerae TaxID=188913 RepID=UPI001F05AE52|nr:ATP-binding cassette domain-containing protein [Cetobacterium somerae]UPO98157.1 ATP-binding cassette domain-containing protein [Cetobacterium somerae]